MQALHDVRPGVVAAAAPLSLDQDADLLEVVVALRDSTELGRRVLWSTSSDVPTDLAALLEHLPPPRDGGGAGGDQWRRQHVYGALYYRMGPGFITVRERRSGRDAAVLTLSGEALTCWAALRSPTTHQCQVCRILEDEGLVLRREDIVVMLPFRLRYPPTPFLAV